mmetsp:Transcript_17655/g.42833  ORF Transcript_17655/g.42833 Transcript_17655/m.42833 type:complete len:208 (+) Transcript_17655:497-1120(+)
MASRVVRRVLEHTRSFSTRESLADSRAVIDHVLSTSLIMRPLAVPRSMPSTQSCRVLALSTSRSNPSTPPASSWSFERLSRIDHWPFNQRLLRASACHVRSPSSADLLFAFSAQAPSTSRSFWVSPSCCFHSSKQCWYTFHLELDSRRSPAAHRCCVASRLLAHSANRASTNRFPTFFALLSASSLEAAASITTLDKASQPSLNDLN